MAARSDEEWKEIYTVDLAKCFLCGQEKEIETAELCFKCAVDMSFQCPHFVSDPADCVTCSGDGTEIISHCEICNPGEWDVRTWHRGDKCLRCDKLRLTPGC